MAHLRSGRTLQGQDESQTGTGDQTGTTPDMSGDAAVTPPLQPTGRATEGPSAATTNTDQAERAIMDPTTQAVLRELLDATRQHSTDVLRALMDRVQQMNRQTL